MEIEQMKKGKSIRAFLIAVIALALVFVAAICVFGADGAVVRGDVNGDGKVNSYDADYLLMHASFPNNPKYAINQSGDMNGDGKVNSYDADRLLMHASFPNNPKYALADSFSEGLEYELNDDGKGYTVSGKGTCKDTNLIIPSTYNNLPVTSIRNSAFRGSTNLIGVTIPDSVTIIDDGAFYGCSGLVRVTLGNGIQSIGVSAFYNCTSLTGITIPNSVKSIGAKAFSGCTSLENINIPGSVTSIGDIAFSHCTSLANITLPDSITDIGISVFYETAYYKNDANWASDGLYIGNYLIKAKIDYSTTSYIIKAEIKCIADDALVGLSNLESITVENGNTAYCVKNNCVIKIATKTLILGFKTSVIPTDGSVEHIGYGAFSSCRGLTNIKIPEGIISIGTNAYIGCSDLITVAIPAGVTDIGMRAFSYCNRLISIVIPSSVKNIDTYAFAESLNIEVIVFRGTQEEWDAIRKSYGWDKNAGKNTPAGKYELAYGGSDPEPPVTTTTTATTTTTTTTTEMVTTTLPMFARFDFGTDTTAQDDGQTSHEWLKNNLSYNESYIKVEFFEDSWKIYALKTYVSGTTPTDAYAVVFQNIADVEYEDLVPGWGTWSRYPVNESYVGNPASWEGKHQYMKIRIKNTTENNMISFGFKGNNNKFATTYCVSNMYMQGGDDKLTCTPSDEWAVYYYDVGKCCQVSSYAYGAGRNNNTDIGVATSFTQWVELYGPTGAYNGLNWTAVDGPCNGLKFNLLGAEKYQAKVPAWCDSRTNIKEGAAVEIDYIIFGSTIEQLEAYKSKIEKDPSLERPKPSDPEAKPSEGLSFVSRGDGTCYVSGIGSCTDTDIVIPAVSPDGDKVTGIGDGAFSWCSSLASITIPDSVTSIGERAFYWCTNLASITIPDSVTSIGNDAFSDCAGLTEAVIGKNVEIIGASAFSGCKNLLSIIIPDMVECIDNCAFDGCISLKSINIPSNTTSIGVYVFANCDNLEGITVESGNTVYHSAGNCIVETATKTLIAGCKNSIIPNDGTVTIIGENAFANCTNLTNITIPSGVTSIGGGSFFCCWNLTSVIIPDGVTHIGDYAFSNCTMLTSIVIPDSITFVGQEAFSACMSLASITIPSSVTSIGRSAFEGCTSLESVTIPDSVTSIGDSAFYSCTSLETITFKGTEEQWNAIAKGDGWDSNAGSGTSSGKYTLVFAPEANPSEGLEYELNEDGKGYAVTGIGTCKDTNLIIPSTYNNLPVTSIGNSAFYNCGGLASITIPDSVTSIGDYAFSYCTSLTSIAIPESVTSISQSAFSGCWHLESITVESGNTVYHSAGNCIIETAAKTLIAGCKNSVIPDDGSVTSIGDYAFCWCTGLTSITIPDSVTSIGKWAFDECFNLLGITIPNSVTSIGDSAFRYCENITSIVIPDSVTSIGQSAFSGCWHLESITVESGNTVYHSAGNCIIETASKTLVAGCQNSVIPDDGSVTSIGDSAFYGCARLASITIPDSVTSIGDEAFYNTGLASITIPDSVTSIGQSAFSGCRHLESITVESGNTVYHSAGNCIIETATKTLIAGCKNSVIPDDGSVTSIGRSAFEDCDGLTNITIPDGVTSIGYSAFRWCSSLTGITIPDSVTNIGSYAFDDTAYYKNGANWTDGVLYIGNYLIKAKSGELPADYTIKAGTKVIADYAFSWCRNLTSITLPNSVTSIGDGAFGGCKSLVGITIPDSVTSIGNEAFFRCTSLTSVTFGENSELMGIGQYAFYCCEKLAGIKIPDGVTSIGYSAFRWCSSLTGITIPDSVTNIGSYAFDDTAYYKNGANWTDGVLYIGNYLIKAKSGELPADYTIKAGTKVIADYAFSGCRDLTSITIPCSVTSIGESAFSYCRNLEAITFKGTEEQWNAITKGPRWDYNAGSNASSGKYNLIFEK